MSKNLRRTVPTQNQPSIVADSIIEDDDNIVAAPEKAEALKNIEPPSSGKLKTHFLSGLALSLLGIFFVIVFVSYLVFWWIDYDILSNIRFSDLLQNQNIGLSVFGGKIGGYSAYLFMQQGFGIAAILFPLSLFLLGLQLLGVKQFALSRLFFKGTFILIFTSSVLGSIPLLHNTKFSVLGGEVGFQISEYLKNVMGNLGFYILASFALICFLAITNILKLNYIERKKTKDTLEELEIDSDKNEKSKNNNYISTTNTISDSFSVTDSNNLNIDNNDISLVELQHPPTPVAPLPLQELEELNNNISSVSQDNTTNSNISLPPSVDTTNEESIDDDNVMFTIEETPTAEPTTIKPKQEKSAHFGIDTAYDPTLELKSYRFPTIDLLEDFGDQSAKASVQNEELLSNKKRIVDTLQNYGIDISQIKATIGPTVTLYEIIPAAGVRISKIKNLEDDIALSLSALGIRIIAPIPGKGTIGIEVPNQNKQIVPMRDMLCCDKFTGGTFDLPIALGKTISNEAYVTDLSKMPHLLVAGATGQGKSVGLNAIIASLLYKKHPAELKFVMVDPKKVELSLFNKIERHYLAKLPDSEEAIITDTRKVVRTLNSLCIEMDSRYDLLKNAEVKNIKEYNKKFISRRLNPQEGHRFLPYIVLIIDEFADLIMTAGKEIEMPIARLAQLARAIGIHLVIATQRPSVNIITGTIKANFPARIAFKVSSKIDSRTILDGPGADQLIGRGDMLLSTGNEIVRLQCAYIDTPEIERITDFIGQQRAYPYAYELPDCPEEGQESSKSNFSEDDRDSLFADVAKFVVDSQQGSTSAVQRKFKLGYNRAGRIIDQLEDAGIVGPLERNNREVKIKDPIALERFLNTDSNL